MIDKKERMLMIVESPNKIKTLDRILKDIGYNNITVSASVGHICELKDEKDKYFNSGIDVKNNFSLNLQISKDKEEVVEKLKEQCKYVKMILIATDDDREGEAIAWSLKTFLQIPSTKYKRVSFHEITKSAIEKAFKEPRDIDENLVNAAQARQCLDKMLGYRLSPIARMSIGAKSVGRCQSAGLKLITDREKEIEEFKPKVYGDLSILFSKDKVDFKAKYFGSNGKEYKQPSMKHCNEVVEDCKGKDYIIKNIVTKEKTSSPKPPFTTSTLQQEVSNKLGIGVKESMSLAQHLFEGIEVNGQHIALITYIRTDCAEFSDEFKPILESYVKKNYGSKYFAPLRKVKKSENAQNGHEAIRPVDLNITPSYLSSFIRDKNVLKVYKIIYDRTIATMMADAITSETTYEIFCGNHQFNLVSKELIFDGYQSVYAYKEKEEDEVVKVNFSKGEKLKDCKLSLQEKKTLPPPRFKEATFIKELEKTGIGRPSTFASIVNTLLDKGRGYCILEDKCIKPTQKGMVLSQFLEKSFSNLINLNYTSELEKDLDLIANGELNKLKFLNEFYNDLESSVKESRKNKGEFKKELVYVDVVCPLCGNKMVLRTNSKNGNKFYGCSKFPKCKGIVNIEKQEKEN